mmetsp:Transcript_20910/g.58145  ORF Transcript_20910/g.58145 Transcript_20910/m.58145 type:complete len:380 (-) Transcript_20910:408-1547(-)
MVSCSLGDGECSAVTDTETFSGAAFGVEVSSGGTVKAGISDNAGIGGHEAGVLAWDDDDLSSVHALSDVVVGLTLKTHGESWKGECCEGLSCASLEFDGDLTLESVVSVGAGDISGKHGSCASISVLDLVLHGGLAFVVADDLDNCIVLANVTVEISAESVDVDNLLLHDLGTALHGCAEEGAVFGGVWDSGEELVDVHRLGLRDTSHVGLAALHEVGTANEVLESGVSQVGHQFTDLRSDELEEVDDVLWCSWELLTELLLLTGDANWASVQVANAGHDTTLGNHGDGSETKLLSTQHGCDDDVTPGADTAIGAESDAITKSVVVQGGMGLGKSEFEWASCVLDGRQWGSSGTSVTSGDLDNIRVGLGNTTGDSSDTD